MDRRTILKAALLSPIASLVAPNIALASPKNGGVLAWCELPSEEILKTTMWTNTELHSSKILEWVSAVTLQIEAYAGVHKIKQNEELVLHAPDWDRILIYINSQPFEDNKIIGVAHGRNFDDEELETIRKLSLEDFNSYKLVN